MPMMNKSWIRAITASTLIGGVLTCACAPALNWREIRPTDADGLIALFPCKPDHVTRAMSWPGVQQVAVHVVSCKAGDAVWALRYTTVPDAPLVPSTLRAWIDELRGRTGYVARLRGQLSIPGMTPQKDAETWQLVQVGTSKDGAPLPTNVMAWHFSHGLTVFQASVWQSVAFEGEHTGEDVIQVFKNGLHF